MTTAAKRVILTLPFPPSVNTYWRSNGKARFLSKNGKAFRKAALESILEQFGTSPPLMESRLRVQVRFHPPDLRERDLDNYWKPILDAMEHGGVYVNDSQIDDEHMIRCEVDRPDGSLVVTVEEIVTDCLAPPVEEYETDAMGYVT